MIERPLPVARLAGLFPGERGLTSAEAEERRDRFGPNDIIEIPGNPFLDLAREIAGDPMIWLLIAVSGRCIAMGQRGTRSAREVAAIVLLDDNLRTIVRAIAEGRQLFRNLQMSFQYRLALHIPPSEVTRSAYREMEACRTPARWCWRSSLSAAAR